MRQLTKTKRKQHQNVWIQRTYQSRGLVWYGLLRDYPIYLFLNNARPHKKLNFQFHSLLLVLVPYSTTPSQGCKTHLNKLKFRKKYKLY